MTLSDRSRSVPHAVSKRHGVARTNIMKFPTSCNKRTKQYVPYIDASPTNTNFQAQLLSLFPVSGRYKILSLVYWTTHLCTTRVTLGCVCILCCLVISCVSSFQARSAAQLRLCPDTAVNGSWIVLGECVSCLAERTTAVTCSVHHVEGSLHCCVRLSTLPAVAD